jgi:hypothetical protein
MAPTIKTRSWSETRAIYEDHVASGLRHAPILGLIKWIEDQGLTSDLFPATLHADLVIGATPTFLQWENMLSIRCHNAGGFLTFQFYKRGSHPEMEKMVPEQEGVETLRLMLAYKFGIHRGPVAEPGAAPNDGPAVGLGNSGAGGGPPAVS